MNPDLAAEILVLARRMGRCDHTFLFPKKCTNKACAEAHERAERIECDFEEGFQSLTTRAEGFIEGINWVNRKESKKVWA